MNMLQEVVLTGRSITLTPLKKEHSSDLTDVGLDPVLWQLQPSIVATREDMQSYVDAALAAARDGTALPFAIVENSSARIIGTTRYMEVALDHRRLEIGYTWLTPRAQRTAANTEAKYLLLRHAFEKLGINRVVLKTESLNEQSKAAILRIGARYEGTFRQHLIAASGRKRDMVYFAILAEDWPGVKAELEIKMQRR